MKTLTLRTLLAGAAMAALTVASGPALADDLMVVAQATDETAETTESADTAETASGSDDHRIPIAETPRDRLGLIVLGALGLGGVAALANARRQLKGERPQASGEFRWR